MNSGLCPLLRAMRLSCTLFLRVAALALPLIGAADEPTVKTYAYKILDSQGTHLQADVHRLPGEAVRPVIVFIHGGALMMGGYLYCRQQGLWPKVLTGRDPDEEPRAFDAFCPVRNVTPEFPPTLLIHGTKDTDVPYELSVQMAKELAAKGVSHKFITIRDGGHGFDRRNADIAARTYQQVVEFLNQHLSRPHKRLLQTGTP